LRERVRVRVKLKRIRQRISSNRIAINLVLLLINAPFQEIKNPSPPSKRGRGIEGKWRMFPSSRRNSTESDYS
jgi:hypothetical protein